MMSCLTHNQHLLISRHLKIWNSKKIVNWFSKVLTEIFTENLHRASWSGKNNFGWCFYTNFWHFDLNFRAQRCIFWPFLQASDRITKDNPLFHQILEKNKRGVSLSHLKKFFLKDFLSKKIFRCSSPEKEGGLGYL